MVGKKWTVLTLVADALTMGVLADWLLCVGPWGMNATLWVWAFAGLLTILVGTGYITLESDRYPLLGAVLLFGLCIAWRSSSALKIIDIFALGILFILTAIRSDCGRIVLLRFSHIMSGFIDVIAGLVWGPPMLVVEPVKVLARRLPAKRSDPHGSRFSWRYHGLPLLRGVVVTIPLLLLFGVLLSSADAAFRALMSDIIYFDWRRLMDYINLEKLLEHGLRVGFCTWVVAGFLRVLVFNARPGIPVERGCDALKLNALTPMVPLAVLDLLFLLFVAVQFRYFFGGHELIAARTGLTYSAYAREGFFQLVAVSALVLALLLGVDWLTREASGALKRALQMLAGLMVALVFVIMLSALQRMRWYEQAYGLTELRLYTTTFMLWLAVVFAWFLATVMRGRRERFLFGAIVAGLCFVAGLHAVNPDALIVRANLARLNAGKPFDAAYAATLSPDAFPVLARALPALSAEERATVEARFKAWAAESHDWRTATWSGREALRVLRHR